MTSPEAALERLRGRLLEQLDEWLAVTRETAPWANDSSPFSAWSPQVHAEHMARADQGSLIQLGKALARDDGPPIRFFGRLVLLLGWLPRGIGKAPAATTPQRVDATAVGAMFAVVREQVAALDLGAISRARGRAHHPAFGGLTSEQWLRFLDIHHRHHLRIVHDLGGPPLGR